MRHALLGAACFVFGLVLVSGPVLAQDDPAALTDTRKQKPWLALYYYKSGCGTDWCFVKKAKSAKALHNEAKHAGRTHVHPKYWAEVRGLKTNDMMFTITLDGSGNEPPATPVPNPSRFCMYYCKFNEATSKYEWQKQATNSTATYEELQQIGYDGQLDFLPCSEPCGNYEEGDGQPKRRMSSTYFTVCKDGEPMTGGKTCCTDEVVPVPPRFYAVPVEKKQHCCLLDRIRTRRLCR